MDAFWISLVSAGSAALFVLGVPIILVIGLWVVGISLITLEKPVTYVYPYWFGTALMAGAILLVFGLRPSAPKQGEDSPAAAGEA